MGIKVGRSRHTTRQHQQIGISIVGLIKLEISLDAYAMGRLNKRKLGGAHRYNINTATTQYVDGNQGLDILEAVSQEYINFCHNTYLLFGFLTAKIQI